MPVKYRVKAGPNMKGRPLVWVTTILEHLAYGTMLGKPCVIPLAMLERVPA